MGESKIYECEFCSRTFDTPQGRGSHRGQAHPDKARPDIACDNCGTDLDRKPSQVNDRNFCDHQCKGQWRTENLVGEDAPNWKPEGDIICEHCGDEFHIEPQFITEHNFCSSDCRDKYRSENWQGENSPFWTGRKTVNCDNCGKDISRTESYINERNFCSQKCHFEWKSENLVGPDSYSWKGGFDLYRSIRSLANEDWMIVAKQIRDEANHKCEHCGIDESQIDTKLNVHHIIPLLAGGDNGEYNLAALCRSCHSKAEVKVQEFTTNIIDMK